MIPERQGMRYDFVTKNLIEERDTEQSREGSTIGSFRLTVQLTTV